MIKLRDMKKNDEELLVQYLNNEQVVRYLSLKIPKPYTSEDAKWWVEIGSKESAIVKAIEFEGVFCGVIGVYNQQLEYSHSAEVGYWIAQKYWNKGIAAKALIEFTSFIFSSTPIIRLFAPVFSANKSSMRVLEKAGYSLEGVLIKAICKHGQYFDEHLFAKVRP